MNTCDQKSVEVNGALLPSFNISAQFSQVTGHDFLSVTTSGTSVAYGFSQVFDPGYVTLISKSNVTCHTLEKIPQSEDRDHIADCNTLSKMELRRRYPREASCHRNMLNRQDRKGAIIHHDLQEFASFLRHLGPMPAHGATVDRIHNDDPEYAPGKVRWADKRTQNSNKGDSNVFHDPATGQALTTAQLAKREGVFPATIRKRLQRGWTDIEIINGKQSTVSPAKSFIAKASREESPAQPRFREMAECYRSTREKEGTEAIVADLETLNDLFSDFPGLQMTEEQYERYFRTRWPDHRPHVDYFNLPQSQMNLIAKIDPEYVAQQLARRAAKDALKDSI